jgi:hypothetical protein
MFNAVLHGSMHLIFIKSYLIYKDKKSIRDDIIVKMINFWESDKNQRRAGCINKKAGK